MNDFWVLKMEKYFGLLTDVKKSLRNVKHRSGILSTRSIISDHQNYISLLIYDRKVEKGNFFEKNEKFEKNETFEVLRRFSGPRPPYPGG